MVSLDQLREADPSAFDDMAEKWARLSGRLAATASDIKTTLTQVDGWHGKAADTARAHFSDVRSGYQKAAEYAEKVPSVLRDLADAITEAQRAVNGALEAAVYPLTVDPKTGQVTSFEGAPGDLRTDAEKEADRARARELTATIQGR